MPLIDLDHLNIRTSRLEVLVKWYEQILGLGRGDRPAFPFNGAWMYLGDRPFVHLVEVEKNLAPDPKTLTLEHGAFRASGFDDFIAVLKAAGEKMRIEKVIGFPIVQVNIWDPDGNHLHIDFDAAECGEWGQKP